MLQIADSSSIHTCSGVELAQQNTNSKGAARQEALAIVAANCSRSFSIRISVTDSISTISSWQLGTATVADAISSSSNHSIIASKSDFRIWWNIVTIGMNTFGASLVDCAADPWHHQQTV